MKSCTGKTSEVMNTVKQAKAAGLQVEQTSETVRINMKKPDGASETIYSALKAHGFWIVRYDPDCFGGKG